LEVINRQPEEINMAVQIVQYLDLRNTIDVNPPTYHYVTYKVSIQGR